MKIKFNLNDNLPLKRKFKLYDMAIIVNRNTANITITGRFS